jgi:ADP-ribose pyrophosphatase YjhB (NUDIX family)
MKEHPLKRFTHCPSCGGRRFSVCNGKAKQCADCDFIYYANASAAVACFLRNHQGEYLLVRRAKEPAKGTLDLPGGFVDLQESVEEALRREIREETNLTVATSDMRYLFSLPNIYPYAGVRVHTVDLFFDCLIRDFSGAAAADDAEGIVILQPEQIRPSAFGLASIRQGVQRRLIRNEGNEGKIIL